MSDVAQDVVQVAGKPFEELEQVTLDRLLAKFHSNTGRGLTPPTFAKFIGIDDEAAGYRLFSRMLSIGALEEHEDHMAGKLVGGSVGPHHYWTISPRVIDIVADRRAALAAASQRPDRVAAAERWLRSHPLLSVALITLIVLTFVVAFINQLIQLVEWAVKTWG